MNKVYLLTDYKGFFGSKASANPHRSGMDKDRLKCAFAKNGIEAVFLPFHRVDLCKTFWEGTPVAYCSSEDGDLNYKSYIEDICYGLELKGARLVPAYKYLRAHHNKVFMEVLRDLLEVESARSIKSSTFGCIEEFKNSCEGLEYPVVLKPASGAGSRSVCLVKNVEEARTKAMKISRSRDWINEAREIARSLKYKGLVRDSRHRCKFIAQNLIPDLKNDWKILVFADKYYVLRREVRPADFRASGSGLFTWEKEVPAQICSFARQIFENLDVPHASLDIAWDGAHCHLIEFQALYFGSLTLDQSAWYFQPHETGWRTIQGPSVLEDEYAASISQYLRLK